MCMQRHNRSAVYLPKTIDGIAMALHLNQIEIVEVHYTEREYLLSLHHLYIVRFPLYMEFI